MFQAKLLRSFVNASSVYDPFYWEDVEWGWRARKLGYQSFFCPTSVVHHYQHATISRYYSADEIEAIWQRNRFLFQLRNFTTSGSLEHLVEAIAQAPSRLSDYFLDRRTFYKIAQSRIWNHLAPISDGDVLRAQ